MATRRGMIRKSPRGFTGVVCWQPKHEVNVGTLWRQAFLYEASFVGTIGRRYERQASDTPNTAMRIPVFTYTDVDDLKAHLPFGCPLIGVEMSDHAVPLTKFWHPPSAVYLLGAEDHGLPASVLAKCHAVVSIPAPREWSMNVAMAGGIVLWDRYRQRLK